METFDISYALEHITVLVDTREQPTIRAKKRLESMNLPYERKKLDFGDYSAKCTLPDDREVDFSASLAVERKMNIDEICNCFCHERKRFVNEFERAKESGAKMYILIENADWEKIYNGRYRSRMSEKALSASLLAFLARYDCQVLFCKAETTGKLIRDIIYREIKERLERIDA